MCALIERSERNGNYALDNHTSLKKSSAERTKILTNGQINEHDLQFQEQLGNGNGGTVFKAYHLLGKRVLAVKVIPLDITVELQKQIMSEHEIFMSSLKICTEPERISGEQYGIHSDVWSVGISFMENPTELPVGQFSEKFVHVITQRMRKQPKERPAPYNLMDHPFIVQYNDGNTEVVSMWVCRSLEDCKAQQAQRLM